MKQAIRRFGQMACFMWLCFGVAAGALAATDGIGVVMNVEGALSAKGVDGVLRPLAVWAKVLAGDTLFTGKDSYARVKFSDGGQISLRPVSQFKIEEYHHDEQEPGKDAAKFNLLKGGLRAISGLIGKRGDPDSYGVKTQTATVGIRGTKFGVLFCKGDCTDIPPPADGKPLEDGTHLDVLEGTIIVRNAAGSQLLNAGQFGFVGSLSTPPVMVPEERGVRVDVPAKIFIDKVRGGSDGENHGAGETTGNPGENGKESAPLVCPI
ncbi:FecR family protein [Candidatus Ferrigenium straubiae]|uniref:FecR family protein n=1 Tax=Candidatus Ferrigenium straubiae TaxID=2919506 RepID=UPI003F4AC3AD